MLKKVLMGVGALVFTLVTFTLVTLLGSVTHADAVGYLDGIDADKLTRPLPGQLYVVSPEGKIEQQLCQIEEFEFDIDRLSGRTFVNRLGETVPGVLRIAAPYLQPDQPGEQELGISYRLEWRSIDREFATVDHLILGMKRILEKPGCDEAIKQTLRSGLEVCQLIEVLRVVLDQRQAGYGAGPRTEGAAGGGRQRGGLSQAVARRLGACIRVLRRRRAAARASG
jgi:hypothetical protein